MKKKFTTVYDETIQLIDSIMVSGGRIGTQVDLKPEDLVRVTEGIIAGITRN
jgi:Cys-tRNA(Pro)/Cys-tRNA(Cys) deacylase